MCFYIQVTQYLLTPGAFVPRQTRRDLSLRLIEHALVFVMITISTVCSRPMKVTDYLWLLQQRPNLPLIGTRARFCLSAAMMVWVSAALLQALDYLSIPNRSQTFHGKHTHTSFAVILRGMWHACMQSVSSSLFGEKKNAHAHTLYQHLCLGLHGNCIMDLP